MSIVVDAHVHVFPDNLEKILKRIPVSAVSGVDPIEKVEDLRRSARHWMKPVLNTIHRLQTNLRYLPDFARDHLDQMAGLVPLPSLVVESTLKDLLEAMDEAGIDMAAVVAHPPFIPNEFVLEVSSANPRLVPMVNIPKKTSKPGMLLKRYVNKGAKALKIHPAADGEGVDSPRYRALLRSASDLGVPVIIHTGCIHSRLIYRDPHQGHAEKFSKWYESYPQTQFVLAHMNFHNPSTALDICEEFSNVWVDTSWQPSEVIAEGVRRIGVERILFGTDWPLVGNNMTVGRKRIHDAVETGLLNEEQAKLILGENAVKLLGIQKDAN